MFEVVFFTTGSGRKPVRDFLDEMPDMRAKARFLRVIQRLGEEGFLPEPFTKSIKGSKKLRELRLNYQTNAYRIFYTAAKGKRIVLLHAFMKKTQKTPLQEIKTAEKRMAQYLEK
jgi:phage-related protein